MNAEQKQRTAHELGQWNAAMKSSCDVADLLAIALYSAPPANNQSEQHLEMVKQELFQAQQALLNEGQQRDKLLAALERIKSIVPPVCGTGFVVDHYSTDGEYLGTENIDPMMVVQEIQSVAHNAIEEVRGGK